ncbi:N-formylglutamate deformylase [Paracoccus endophyticus]|uniref:N-formylglutamate deformylase n=1 Tax=Paracoccus endophyticus TaxID=2233774 RepID=UPI001F0C834E|nr:N-formylglutamate deformylase [Paracoccus endophyticus]
MTGAVTGVVTGVAPDPVVVQRGDGPVVLGLPHVGTWLPPAVHAALNDRGRRLADTDWHVEALYDGLLAGATTVRATFHRYVIDANRSPADDSLYPGQNTTGLVPLTDFDGHPIWDTPPDAAGIEARRGAFHAPYHGALAAELDRVRARHGVAILYDCHSIRSRIPFLFAGTLPDFNIGTADGTTCDPRIEDEAARRCRATGRTTVVNGRFKGGWTTRHYGRPDGGIHAIQMELAQSTHLTAEAPPFDLDPGKAAALRPVLADILQTLAALAPDLRG